VFSFRLSFLKAPRSPLSLSHTHTHNTNTRFHLLHTSKVMKGVASFHFPPPATRVLLSITPLDVTIKIALYFLLVAAVFFLLWLAAPVTTKDGKLRASWALKAVSIVHAVVVAGAAIWALFRESEMRVITAGVLQRDAETVQGPLIHAQSDVVAMVAPLTLAYFIFDLLLVSVWEGKMTVRFWFFWRERKRERPSGTHPHPSSHYSNTFPFFCTTGYPFSPGLWACAIQRATGSYYVVSLWSFRPHWFKSGGL